MNEATTLPPQTVNVMHTLEQLAKNSSTVLGAWVDVQRAALTTALRCAFAIVPQLEAVELSVDGDDYLNANRPLRTKLHFEGLLNVIDLSEYTQSYVNDDELDDLALPVMEAACVLSAAGWDRLSAWELDIVFAEKWRFVREEEDHGMPSGER